MLLSPEKTWRIAMRIILVTMLFLFFSFKRESSAQVINQLHPFSRALTGAVSEGYLFITPVSLDTASLYPSSLSILDSIGNPVFFKPRTNETSPPYIPVLLSDFKVQPSGYLSFAATLDGGGMGMYVVDSNFMVIDTIQCVNDVDTDGHDFIHLADGSYHLVGTEERVMDLSNLTTASGVPGNTNATVVGNVIQRLDAEKNLLFEWKSLDHFALEDVYSHFFMAPNFLDHSHYNSLFLDTDGHYLVSFRHLHEVTKINSETGEIIWRFGGKQNQFALPGDTMLFSAQHDARRTAAGTLTLFDNGAFNSTPVARALEYQLDETMMTATTVWQFHEPNGLASQFIGSTQRLANGNTLIDWGGAFPLNISTTFTEVDAAGNTVMALDFIPPQFISYRGLKQQLPFSLPRPHIDCDGQNLTLTAPPGYAYYEWNTGEHTQSIMVSDTGSYQVWVDLGMGYISSIPFYIENMNDICNLLAVQEMQEPTFTVYPNPATSIIHIIPPGNQTEGKVSIVNSLGQRVIRQPDAQGEINLSGLEPGLYLVEWTSHRKTHHQKLIIQH